MVQAARHRASGDAPRSGPVQSPTSIAEPRLTGARHSLRSKGGRGRLRQVAVDDESLVVSTEGGVSAWLSWPRTRAPPRQWALGDPDGPLRSSSGGRAPRDAMCVRRVRGRPGAARVEPLVDLPWIGRAPGPRTITLMPPTRLARPSRVGFDLRGATVGRQVPHHLRGVASRFATAHRSRRVELNPGDAADTAPARGSGRPPSSHGRGHWRSSIRRVAEATAASP